MRREANGATWRQLRVVRLEKRFDSGPIDWSDWMTRMKTLQEAADRKAPAAAPAASRP